MTATPIFLLDGVAYAVEVMALVRKFSVLDTDKSGRTQDGQMYRDVIGTFYHYTLTVGPSAGDTAALEAFWEAISSPQVSHICVFPYGQKTLTQRMYITAGEQALHRVKSGKNYWGELTVNFIAMEPEVVA